MAAAARAEFVRWHLYSLVLNMFTALLVTIVMAQAAFLPTAVPTPTGTAIPNDKQATALSSASSSPGS